MLPSEVTKSVRGREPKFDPQLMTYKENALKFPTINQVIQDKKKYIG